MNAITLLEPDLLGSMDDAAVYNLDEHFDDTASYDSTDRLRIVKRQIISNEANCGLKEIGAFADTYYFHEAGIAQSALGETHSAYNNVYTSRSLRVLTKMAEM